MIFDSTSYVHTTENRKMPFKGTEATICDAQGDFLMSTNGIWIANAINDTMLNGSGLSPSLFDAELGVWYSFRLWCNISSTSR
jgi:hypothetical protein